MSFMRLFFHNSSYRSFLIITHNNNQYSVETKEYKRQKVEI